VEESAELEEIGDATLKDLSFLTAPKFRHSQGQIWVGLSRWLGVEGGPWSQPTVNGSTGRVGMWRGGGRLGMSVAAPFV
jgi:hypothetical protein